MANQQSLSVLQLHHGVITTTTTGDAVDLQGKINPGGRNMKVFISAAAVAGTTPSITVKIQHSDTTTSADFTDAPIAPSTTSTVAFTALTTTGSDSKHFVTNKRYIRTVITYTSNTTSAAVYVGVLTEKRYT